MQIVTKPLDLINYSELPVYMFDQGPPHKLTLITGAEGVGKTAFLIKYLNGLSSQRIKLKFLYISFDDSINYWQKQIDAASTASLPTLIKVITPPVQILGSDNILFERWVTDNAEQNKSDVLIFDGVDFSRSKSEVAAILCIVANLMLYGNKFHIIVTLRNQEDFPSIWLEKLKGNSLLRVFALERPDYVGKDVKEFGKTLLTIT